MTTKYILALDIGTTRVTATFFDHNCNNVHSSSKKITQYSTKPGWYEQDANEIWDNILSCITNILIISKIKPEQIASIGISNQRETTVIWDKRTGKPIHYALMWESRQTNDLAQKLISDGYAHFFHEHTGLRIDPYFSATKIQWILSNVKNAREQANRDHLLFGTLDTWIIWKLTNGKQHVTDYTNACRTLLFNINSLKWDTDILKLLDIPKSILPDVKSNSEIYGYTSPKIFFNSEIPISCSVGDQQAALVGQLAIHPGNVAGTFGTGAFIIMNTGERMKMSNYNLLTTIAYSIDNKFYYALEGSIFVAGSAFEWLKNGMQIINNVDEIEKLAKLSTDKQQMYMVPAFTGLSAPYWNPKATASAFGMTEDTTKYDFIRATLESIAYQTTDILNYMQDETNISIDSLKINGKLSEIEYLTKFQADISNRTIVQATDADVDSRGVAFLSGLAVGFWESFAEIEKLNAVGKQFYPKMSIRQRKFLYAGWTRAVKATESFVK